VSLSVFLGDITSAYRKNPELENLLFDDFFNTASETFLAPLPPVSAWTDDAAPSVHKAQSGWRRIIAQTALWGIPTPAFSTALAFYDGYRTERLPASLLQAQRDYFGAHTFRILPEFLSEKCTSLPSLLPRTRTDASDSFSQTSRDRTSTSTGQEGESPLPPPIDSNSQLTRVGSFPGVETSLPVPTPPNRSPRSLGCPSGND
jgi:hypothetical protein